MVDRTFLNGYIAKPRESDQLCWFVCRHRGQETLRYELLGQMTREFVAAVESYAALHGVDVVHFEKGQRKEPDDGESDVLTKIAE